MQLCHYFNFLSILALAKDLKMFFVKFQQLNFFPFIQQYFELVLLLVEDRQMKHCSTH
jgi:hypothetical protein